MDTSRPHTPERKKTSAPRYIPIEAIIDARQKGLTQPQIAKLYDVTPSAISRRLKDVDIPGLEKFKRNRADIFAHKQRQILDAITPAKMEGAAINTLAVSLGIMYDKERLERGQSTANVSYKGTLEAVDAKMQEMAAELRAMGESEE